MTVLRRTNKRSYVLCEASETRVIGAHGTAVGGAAAKTEAATSSSVGSLQCVRSVNLCPRHTPRIGVAPPAVSGVRGASNAAVVRGQSALVHAEASVH